MGRANRVSALQSNELREAFGAGDIDALVTLTGP